MWNTHTTFSSVSFLRRATSRAWTPPSTRWRSCARRWDATPKRSESCFTTTATECRGPPSTGRSGCSTRYERQGIGWSLGSRAEATFGSAQRKHVDVTKFSPPSNELRLLSGNSVYGTVKVMGSVQCAGPLILTQQRFMADLISSSSGIRAAVKLSLSTFMIHSLKVEHLCLRVLMFLNDKQHC